MSGGDNEDTATEERISQILSEAQAAMQRKHSDDQVCTVSGLSAMLTRSEPRPSLEPPRPLKPTLQRPWPKPQPQSARSIADSGQLKGSGYRIFHKTVAKDLCNFSSQTTAPETVVLGEHWVVDLIWVVNT